MLPAIKYKVFLLFLISSMPLRSSGTVFGLHLQVLHVGGQIDIMKQALKQMSASNGTDTSLPVIRDLICRHQKIITMSNSIETVFSFIALMQLLWNTLIICCAGFLIIIVSKIDFVSRSHP